MAKVALTPAQEVALRNQAAEINALQLKLDQAENCNIDCLNLRGASTALLNQISNMLAAFPSQAPATAAVLPNVKPIAEQTYAPQIADGGQTIKFG